MKQVLKHPITGQVTEDTIVVYQAYSDAIGQAAAKSGTLAVPGFSMTRMTWIKPSFLWMMYRAGWGRKDAGQSTLLRIVLTRVCFCNLLQNACLSSYDADAYPDRDDWKDDLQARPNRVQWDPDKDMHLAPTERRAIQIGIAAAFVPDYIDGIRSIEDITEDAQRIEALIRSGRTEEAAAALPLEQSIPDGWLS